jgi:hypothetical protein
MLSTAFDLAVKIMELSEISLAEVENLELKQLELTCDDILSLQDSCSESISSQVSSSYLNSTFSTSAREISESSIVFTSKSLYRHIRDIELVCLLSVITPYVDELLLSTMLTRNGSEVFKKLLYYKFKHRVFFGLAIDRAEVVQYKNTKLYSTIHAQLEILFGKTSTAKNVLLLESACEIWEEMHEFGFHGYGRGIRFADPYAEGTEIMEKVAVMNCISGNWHKAFGLFLRAISLTQEVWGQHIDDMPETVNTFLMRLTVNAEKCANDSPENLPNVDDILRLELLSHVNYFNSELSLRNEKQTEKRSVNFRGEDLDWPRQYEYKTDKVRSVGKRKRAKSDVIVS